MVGILLSYWGSLFSGATLVSGRVIGSMSVFYCFLFVAFFIEALRFLRCDTSTEWVFSIDMFPFLKPGVSGPVLFWGCGKKTPTPWKINGWNLQITHLERKMIFQTSMIMFHVNLPGCILRGSSQLLSG